jgi:AraC family transcriptional regulator of adaptative response / DNA-3-methyladenine glycosylase II
MSRPCALDVGFVNGADGREWRVASRRLPFAGPLDWAALLAYFARRAIPGVEHVSDDTYRRTVMAGGDPAVVEITCGPGHLVVRSSLPVPLEPVRRLFNLDADVGSAVARLSADPVIGTLVRAHPGRRAPGAWDPFEVGVRAIVGQQVSVAGASTLTGRLAARHGSRLAAGDGLSRVFPSAAVLAEADLDGVGLTRVRTDAVRAFARAVAAGSLRLVPDGDLVASVEAVRGLGPWTAQYLAFRLGDPDAFPASDLGLQRALARRTGVAGVTAAALATRAEAWRPWRATAAAQLWLAD